MLNKVTRGRLFADNELWILAALPLCLVPPSIYHDKLFAATSPYHILPLRITGWHPDWLMIRPRPLRCPIVFCFIYPPMNGAPVSSHLDLTEPPCHLSISPLNSSPSQIIFLFPSCSDCAASPPPSISLLLLLLASRLLDFATVFWKKKMHLCLALGRTFKMSVLISTLTLPLYCFIISPSAKKKKRKKKKKKHQIVHKQKGSIIPLSPLQPCISLGHSILCLVDLFLFLSSFSFLAFHTYSAPFLFNLSLFLISIIYFPSLSLSLSLSLHLLLHPSSIPEPLQKQRVMTKMMRVEDGERGDKYRE